MTNKLPSERIQKLLLEIFDHFEKEDRAVRERQIRKCRRLKLYWDNIFQIWYSETAHDWRIWDEATAEGDDGYQSYYDKPMNVFRAYIESIIAALSITTPAAKCYPEDAEVPLDIITAKAGDKIGQLIARHNEFPLLWLKGLYTFYTEGTVYAYNHSQSSDKYGTYQEPVYKQEAISKNVIRCTNCGNVIEEDPETEVFQPEKQSENDICPNCGSIAPMQPDVETFVTTKIIDNIKNPKSRTCIEVYGGLYVKIDNQAKTQAQTPYLIFAHETNFVNAVEQFKHLRDNKDLLKKLKDGGTGPSDPYTQWGRLNTLYQGEYPMNVVTLSKGWFRPCAYNILADDKDVAELNRLYPRGIKICKVNDEFGECEPQDLDDYWTITHNPMEDYLAHDAQGVNLVAGQEITNDIISLVLQTMEHGIGQTFADPGVLNFPAYRKTETTPGGVYEASPKSGKSLADGFFEMKTATLSAEVMPFFEMIQSLNQLVCGALPSLFGGQIEGSNTASEYSMSRAQALQRIQNTWKIFTAWWRVVNSKAIPMFINNMKADEKDVQRQDDGSFINVFIRRAELEGRIGKIELEASEALPSTWSQVKDTIMKVFESQNEFLISVLTSPENIPLLQDAIGLTDFYIPGEDDRNKQYDEIRELLASSPIQDPEDPNIEIPSVEIDPIYDNHQIQFEIVRKWAISDAGREAKINNEAGYMNVLLHGQMHFMQMQQQMAEAAAATNGAPKEKPTPDEPRKVNEESDVSTSQ